MDETRPSETDEAASEYKDRNTATTVTTTSFTKNTLKIPSTLL